MATIVEPVSVAPEVVTAEPALLRRPRATTGFWSWFTTIDHKKIGILYGVTAFIFFIVGGLEATLIRLQLAQPNGTILSADSYNQVFTMHGTTMIFLVVMPMTNAFFNYLIPLMIGARDVAFPRLNAFSYWTFLFGALLLNSSWLLGGAPNGGWFGYAPQTSIVFSPGHNIDFWIFGLLILGISSTVGAVNFVVTILNLRAPGMTFFRMPLFAWMTLVTVFLLLFAMPIITIALFLLMFDRLFGANFFNPAAGGDPLLWQHLFWLFGHPEVYILILPSMGMVSEILPVFARKPLFGYPVVVFSGIAIGFMGWGVWVHHMFATGLGPVAISAFSVSTMFIAVPTGVKIFNWLATCWGGSLRFRTPMLFALAFIFMFTIGGLSGVTHAISPHDRQQTDTYYVVAHFHYVLFGGALFGIMGGLYYWWPKFFGHMLREGLGKVHFWLWFIGFNLTFGPFHMLGLMGMPRRVYTYADHQGWNFYNLISTIGVFVIILSVLVFLHNVFSSRRQHRRNPVPCPNDPWDARTLEWTIASPPPAHNFDEVPTVHALDDWWHRKYTEDEQGRLVRIESNGSAEADHAAEHETEHETEHDSGHGIHMPSPSYYPLVASFGLPVMAYGMIYSAYYVSIIGALIVLAGLYAWAIEPSAEPEEEAHEPPPAVGPGDGEGELVAVGAGDAPAEEPAGEDTPNG